MGIFRYGATGNGASVDASGRLLSNSVSGSSFVLDIGDTGGQLRVDASGRLMISDSNSGEQSVSVDGAATTIDFTNGGVVALNLSTSATTLTLNNAISGLDYTIIINQNAATGGTITWPASVKWPGGTAPTITNTASSVDIAVLTKSSFDSSYYGRFYADLS